MIEEKPIISYEDVRNAQKGISEHPKNQKETIDFSCFEKLDLRVAEIKKVEEIEGADKLYKLKIDIGELGKRTLVAGIKQHYSKDELIGKKIIIIANLEPRKLKGITSEGMLLAASDENKEQVILLTPKLNINSGIKITFKNE